MRRAFDRVTLRWAPLALLIVGCGPKLNIPILEPRPRAIRGCLAAPPDAAAPPPDADPADQQHPSRALDELRIRAQGLLALTLQRSDREVIERTLAVAWGDLRAMSSLADEVARGPAESAALALALAGRAWDQLADLEASAHEHVELSAAQAVARTRMEEEAAQLERQANLSSSRHTARHLLERAQAIRARAATYAQASAAQVQELHAAQARGARGEAIVRYARAVVTVDRAHVARGAPEIGGAFARLVDPALQGAIAEALRQQTEFAYTPGMFLEMHNRWLVGY